MHDTANRPLVSVVVPTYNRADALSEAIDSILGQSHSALEVVVVNDGSEDHTEAVLRRACEKDPRVVYHRNARNLGCGESRNTGIAMARGEYVTFLDDDDMYLPDKVARQAAILANEPEIDVVVSGLPAEWCTADPDDTRWISLEFQPNRIFDGCRIMCRRAVLEHVRLRCNYMEWRDLAFQLYENGYRVRLTSENHVRKSKSEGSLSANEEAMILGALENATTYEARTRGRDEHAIFKRYLANCQKNVANYCLKRGRLWRAVRGYRDAYRTGGRLKDLVPFARQDSGE